jgi:shikimate dehydrogenase
VSAPRPTRVVLLGHPVGHSLSPVFQQAAMDSCGISARYETLDVAPADLPSALAVLVSERAAGNVTIPHKHEVRARCSRVTDVATRADAVNVFWVDADGALVGDNTDVGGFDFAAKQLLADRFTKGLRIALIGAGGSAAAVCAATSLWPTATVSIATRTPSRAEALAERFAHVSVATNVDDALRGADLVVNATPIGMRDTATPFDVQALSPSARVLDLVYRSGGTQLVRLANERGIHAADGLGMLIEQGALAFERWFGVSAPREVMWNAVRRL